MQPAKPSFLEYFEQKEKEANVQKEGGDRHNNADNRGPEGNLQVVRSHTELQQTQEPFKRVNLHLKTCVGLLNVMLKRSDVGVTPGPPDFTFCQQQQQRLRK